MATLDSLDDMPADPGVQASEPSVLPPAEAPKTDDVADVWSDAAWQGWGSTWWRPGWSSWQWRENGWGSGAYWSGWQGSARSYQAADAGPSDARATGNAGSQLGGSTRATGDGGSTGEASQVDPWAAAAAAISAAAAAQDRVLPADQAQDRGAPVGRDAARLPDPAQERSGEQSGASGGWSSAWNDSWRWSGGNAKGDYSDPPPFPGWAHRRYWTAAVRRWNKNTDVPLFRRGEKVLRSLGWELQADMEHISEDELSRDTYLETILAVIDAKAGVREDDEKRRAFKAVMTENQRKREESLSQYSLRRLRDFQRAMSFGFDLPPELKAAMLREGASLSEQNMQNLAAILRQDDKNPDLVAKALCHLDVRSDRLIGYVDEARPADEPGASTFVSEEVEEGEDEELSDDEVIAELGALDLYEDQICEVFAVLDGNGAFKKRRSWKENRIMKAEMRKDRGSFIKGSDAPPKGHGGGLPGGRDVGRGRDHRGGGRGRGSMTREQLKKISRCRGCGQKGHWVAECPNKGAPSGFVYMPEQPQASSIAFSFLTRQEILAAALEVRAARPTNLTDEAAWSYLTMPSGDAIIDTGATQDLIGTVAFRALSHRLAEVGLKAVKIDVPCAVPSGIGGKATVEQVVLVPISPGGCSGVLQMVVLATDIPPLLSIGFMDFMGTVIDLPAKEVRFTKHRCTLPLNELPSGHRSIPLVEWPGGKFEVPAQLREKFGLSENAFDLKQGSFLQYIKETVPREHAGCERSVSTSIIPEEAPVHFPSKSQTVRFESVTGALSQPLDDLEPSALAHDLVCTSCASVSVGSRKLSMCSSSSSPASRLLGHGSGGSFVSSSEMLASGGVSDADNPREQPSDVLQACTRRAGEEEPPGAVEVRGIRRECSRCMFAPGESNSPSGKSVGVLADLHSVPGSGGVLIQAKGQEQGKGQSCPTASGGGGGGDHDLNPLGDNVPPSSTWPERSEFLSGCPDGEQRAPEHDADLPPRGAAAECEYESSHGPDQSVSARPRPWTKPDADDGGRDGDGFRAEPEPATTGRAAGQGGDGGRPRGRVGRGEPERGGHRQSMSWPLWVTTSFLSITSVLAWDQCCPEMQERTFDSLPPGSGSPSWVLYEDETDANQTAAMRPLAATDFCWASIPPGLREVVFAVSSSSVPEGWQGIGQETRAANGNLLYRGAGDPELGDWVATDVTTTLWVMPARLATAWCSLGERGHVEALDRGGEPSSRGPFWIIFSNGSNSLLSESASEVTPEEPLRGDEALIKKGLFELTADPQNATKGVDYMEILLRSPLPDHLRQRGLKASAEEATTECLSAVSRAKIRAERKQKQPKVLFARWNQPEGGTSEARRAVEARVIHRFVCELAQEQRRDGLHFLVDYEVMPDSCGRAPEDEEILSFAAEVLQYEQDGAVRVRAGSFATQVSNQTSLETDSFEGLSDECLGDRTKEEELAKELLAASDFSFAACQDLISRTSLPGGTPMRSGTRGPSASSICTFGLFSHGGLWGITRQSKLRPHFTNYINQFLDWHGAACPRTSFSVNTGVGLGIHVDKYNLRGTMNSVISFGQHEGGCLWAEDACQAMGGEPKGRCDRVLEDGRRLHGQRVDPLHKMVTFDAHYYHEVEPWRGRRYSVACWTNHSLGKIDARAKRRLRTLGFRPDAPRQLLQRRTTFAGQASVCEAVKALSQDGSRAAASFSSFPTSIEAEMAEENEAEDDPPEGAPRATGSDSDPRLRVSESQKRLVHKVHVNVGHPPKARFLRMMRAAGALPHVLQYIKSEYECDQCSIRQRPDNRHRARCPRSFEFNRVLSIDIFYVKFGPYQVPILNMTDTGTCYQVLQRLPIPTGSHGGTPTSEATWRAFLATWIRFFGPPEVLVCDAGSEFKAVFERGCEGQGILQHVVLPENPWKNAMSERHGGFVKHRLDQELSSGQCVLQNWEDLDDYLHEMLSVKNRWLSRGGVSPTQLVFGKLPRVPGDLLSDDHTGLMALHDALEDPLGTDQAATEYRRRMGIRERARQATMAQASREAVQRAVKASTHQTRRFYPGQWVYCFRRGRPGDPLHPRDRWVGPGLVVVANNSTVYVGMRTRLWRCSPEQLRLAHPAEEMGHQLASDPGLSELLRRVLSGSTAGAINVMREGPPSEGDRLAPVNCEEVGPPLAAEAPQSQAEEVVPVPPALLPPGLPAPADREPVGVPEAPGGDELPPAPSRRSSVSEPAGEPPSQHGDPLPGIPEEELEDAVENEEPVRKAPRIQEAEGTRAPGTPIQPLLQAVRNADAAGAGASSSTASLTPSEEIPDRGRVDRQVREWEEVTAGRSRERTPPPRGPVDREDEELYQSFLNEDWSGTFYNFQLGNQDIAMDSGEWTWLAKRNDEVSLRDLAKAERDMFESSDLLEWKSIIDSGAVKVLTGSQAQEARARHPSRILSSRMVRRKKPVPGLGKWKPKSRWCIHGHHDPDTGSLVTYAPTPASESLQLFLQASINLRHVRAYADVKAAFTQSLPLKRPAGPIFAEPCDGLQLPSGALIQILIPVYGLDDAPAAWRETVAQYLVQEAGFTRNLVEPCWFSKFEASTKRCIAQILVEVDDFIVSAKETVMPGLKSGLQGRFRFGKWEEGDAEYAGRFIEDKGDHLAVSQEKYIIGSPSS